MTNEPPKATKRSIGVHIRYPSLLAVQKKIELPMLVLSFFWLCILIAELVYTGNKWLHNIGTILWAVFILYFLMRLMIVGSRRAFLKKNWLFAAAVLVSVARFFPILQSFPITRLVTATFGMQVIWIFASADQGMRSIRRILGSRGVGYILAFTSVVMVAGAAGILHFEQVSDAPERIQTFPRALWWTTMQMTNIGSAYSMKSQGGRAICLLISVYAAAMFGYLTALFASFFIDREIKDPKIEIARQKQLSDMQNDLARLCILVEKLGLPSEKKQIPTKPKAPMALGANSHEMG